jgi:hypothetical protein
MNWVGTIKKAIGSIGEATARPNARNFTGEIDAVNDPAPEAVNKDAFKPEQSYFSVRIADMRLAEASRYFVDFIPMCSCFLRYRYGRTQMTLPFFLGNEFIKSGLGGNSSAESGKNIQFKDIYIVQNVPVKADNLLMYAALCRVKDSGFARGMLDFLADTAGTVGGATVGAAVHTGVDLTKRLAVLMGADGVETRFGMLNGRMLDKSGYRMMAGVAAKDLNEDDLTIENGQLRRKSGANQTIDDVDYLVLAVEYRKTLVDPDFAQVSTLPFHARFDEVRTKLINGDKAGAADALKPLLVDVATSPDVTEADRLGLTAAYRGAFDQWADANKLSLQSGSAVSALQDKLGAFEGSGASLVESARVSLIEARDDGKQLPDLNDEKAVRKSLARRAAAVGGAALADNASEGDLSAAASALFSAAFEVG